MLELFVYLLIDRFRVEMFKGDFDLAKRVVNYNITNLEIEEKNESKNEITDKFSSLV